MALTVGELKEFIADLPDNTEVVIESIFDGEDLLCVETADISFHDSFCGCVQSRRLVLVPKEFGVKDGES